jgi:hypothetical protein
LTAGHDDPISAASSGLRALGVAPQRRVETLGLLSALLDLSDNRGEVLLDAALIATEERLGIDACLAGYEWLERLGIITRTWSGWMIRNFAAHHGPAGMTEASMAVLRRHLVAGEDTPLVTVPVTPVVEAAPVVSLRPWRRRVPAIAASVAAGVAVLAGAATFTPQAAVSHRDAAIRTEGTADAATRALTSLPSPDTSAATTAATNAAAAPSSDATTTTTSTTLLPGLPCLNQAVNDLASRSGLNLGRDSSGVLPPGVLPCP